MKIRFDFSYDIKSYFLWETLKKYFKMSFAAVVISALPMYGNDTKNGAGPRSAIGRAPDT